MDALRLAGLDLSKEFRFTRTPLAIETGLRGAIGMSVPILFGFAAGQPGIGPSLPWVAGLRCWPTSEAPTVKKQGQCWSEIWRLARLFWWGVRLGRFSFFLFAWVFVGGLAPLFGRLRLRLLFVDAGIDKFAPLEAVTAINFEGVGVSIGRRRCTSAPSHK